MNNLLTIRKAVPDDISGIHGLLEYYADRGVVLRRGKDNIRQYLENFTVGESDGKILGCAAVRDFGNNLLEIRSLAVWPEFQRSGIGRAMVEAIIAGLKITRPQWRLFTLTYRPDFFCSLGFEQTVKEEFPDKIWSDCAVCAKFSHCDEIALKLDYCGSEQPATADVIPN